MKKEPPLKMRPTLTTNTTRCYTAQERAVYCQKWEQSKSQLSQSEFCKREGVSRRSLHRWLSASKSAQPDIKLLPVEMMSQANRLYELSITFPDGIVIRLPWRPDKQMVQWIKDLLS